MKRRTFYYKRTIKRVTKLVSEFIKQHGEHLPLDHIYANPVTGDVNMEGGSFDEPYVSYPVLFFTRLDDNLKHVVDERSIRRWVMVDVRRMFVAVTTPVHLPLRSL